MLNLKKLIKGYQDSARSSGDLLPWVTLWDEGTVLTSDMGLVSCFTYAGLDAEGKSEVEVDSAVNAYERAFASFGSGTAIWTIIDRRRNENYPSGKFDNPSAGLLESVWRDYTTSSQYTNAYSLAVYQRSSEGAMAFLDSMDRIVKEEDISLGMAFLKAAKTKLSVRAKVTFDEKQVSAAREALRARVDDLQGNLGSLGLRRLEGEELLGYLHARANPVSGIRSRVVVPRIPAFLNTYLANDTIDRLPRCLEFSDGISKKFVGVISLKGWPQRDSVPGMLDYLTAIDAEVTVCHCFKPIDREVAVKAIASKEKYHLTAAVPALRRLLANLTGGEPKNFDQGRLALAADAEAARAEISANNRMFGYHSMTLLAFADSKEELDRIMLQLQRRLSLSEFTGMAEGMHALGAWQQTLPGQWRTGVRWTNVSFGNQADIAPIRTLWSGPMKCGYLSNELQQDLPVLASFPTDSGVPFNFDPFESGAGHMATVGPTRNGKSVLVNFLWSVFKKYPRARVFHFDKDRSGYIPTLLQEGRHIDLTNDPSASGVRMSPMGLVSDRRHHRFLQGWVRRLIEDGKGEPLSPDEIDMVNQAVVGLRELDRSQHRLGNLGASLGTLRKYIDDWIGDGSRGGWFDNEPSIIDLSESTTFEMKALLKDRTVAAFALDYLFYMVELALEDRVPTVINVEETWYVLEDEIFVAALDNLLRTAGKLRGCVWITTQAAYELTTTHKLKAMLEQFKNYIFLPNAKIFQNPSGYDLLGLTPEQMERIQAATPKRDYYFKTPSMSRMCSIHLPREILVNVEAGGRAIQTFDRHYESRESNPNWKLDYFEEMTQS